MDGPSIVTLTFSVSWSTSSSVQLTPSTPLSVESRSDISTRDGLWGFRTSKTIRLMSLNGLRLRETVSTGTFDNKRSLASPGRDFRAGGSHAHRVLCLRHDSAADVQQRWVRHHGPVAHEPIQQGGRVGVEAVRPSLRERQGLELRRENLQKVVQLGLFHRLRLEDPIDVAGPTAVDLARAGRGERLNRDDLAGVEGVVPVRDVRHALARMQEVPLDRVAGEVANRTEPVRLDRPLNPLAEGSRRDASVDGLDRRLEGELGGPRESRPVPRADLHSDRGVGDPAVELRSEVELDDVPAAEAERVIVGRGVVGRDVVDRDARRERRSGAFFSHDVLHLLGDIEQQHGIDHERDGAFARSRGIGWAGTRRAIRRSLESTAGGACGRARRTTVYGPGRFFSQNASAIGVGSPNWKTSATPATAIEIGWSRGRPFTWKTRSTAAGWNGSAPSP